MTPRLPSREERALWREANRETAQRIAPQACDEEPPIDASAPVPSAKADADAATAPRRKVAARSPLTLLAPRAAAKFFKPFGPVEATLDLHGLGREAAYAAVQRFIFRQQSAGVRHVAIITGKGRGGEGVLRQQVPHWLNEPALRGCLSAMAHAPAEKGGNGVLHVLIKKTDG